MSKLKKVITSQAKTKDEFISEIVDYKGLKGTLTYYDRYKKHKKDDKGFIFDLTIGGIHYRLIVEFYENILFLVGEEDAPGYYDDVVGLVGGVEFIGGKIFAQSIELWLYRDNMVLVEQEELFLYGSEHGWSEISFNVNSDDRYIFYNGVTGLVSEL